MRNELEKKLVDDFPRLFQEYGALPSVSCMAFGLECGDGWYAIMRGLCQSIEGYYRDLEVNGLQLPEPVVLTQVKEKFGTLSVYYSGGDRSVRSMVSMAEVMSSMTCEECGSTDDVHMSDGGWLYVRCKSCIDKSSNRSEGAPLL